MFLSIVGRCPRNTNNIYHKYNSIILNTVCVTMITFEINCFEQCYFSVFYYHNNQLLLISDL